MNEYLIVMSDGWPIIKNASDCTEEELEVSCQLDEAILNGVDPKHLPNFIEVILRTLHPRT